MSNSKAAAVRGRRAPAHSARRRSRGRVWAGWAMALFFGLMGVSGLTAPGGHVDTVVLIFFLAGIGVVLAVA